VAARTTTRQDHPLRICPLHEVVTGNHRRHDVENLRAEPAPSVEDRIVGGASKRVLTVGGDAIGDDAFLLLDLGSCDRISVSFASRSNNPSSISDAAKDTPSFGMLPSFPLS
jgi:hypothetical protein